nr:right-handed parallel beta-helix repeat-containing protein [Acidobacteriota bacterium]
GDILLVHAGDYGGRIRFDKPGAVDNYLVWKAAGDGEVTMNGIDIAASHIWLEGLTIRNQTYATFSIAAPDDVVVSRCGFYNNHYSIYLQQGGTNWYIADNTIVGDTDALSESFDGEGIELNQTSGHTVAHNSITNVADGISYPLRNVDILGNDIFDTSDDGIEGDYGYANVRMWGNRIHNAPAPVPAAPTELTAKAVTGTRIDPAWRDNSDGETGFAVERSADGTTFVQVATVGAGVVNYANTGLKQNRTYYYRVRAFNTAGHSAFSNVVTMRTLRK